MFRLSHLMACFSLWVAGCGESDSLRGRATSDSDDGGLGGELANGEIAVDGTGLFQRDDSMTAEARSRGIPVEHTATGRGGEKTSVGSQITHEDLAIAIARSNDQSTWYNGERTVGELAGTWTAVDGSGHPLVFRTDGSFSQELAGKMTEGVFAISEKGQILTYSKRTGIGLRSHFRFDGKTIWGPRGPLPNAEWKRSVSLAPGATHQDQ